MFAALKRIFSFFDMGRSAAPRYAEIARLNAKSDAELARLHIRRDEIASRVFQDKFYA